MNALKKAARVLGRKGGLASSRVKSQSKAAKVRWKRWREKKARQAEQSILSHNSGGWPESGPSNQGCD